MDNKEIEGRITTTLNRFGTASRAMLLAELQLTDPTVLDRALERMKRRGGIAFDKPAKAWTMIVNENDRPTAPPPSPVSALPDEGGVQLGDANLSAHEPASAAVAAELTEINMNTPKSDDTSKLDAALNAAKARKKNPNGTEKSTTARTRLSAEEKAKRDEALEAERAAKKLAREAKRAERQAAREAAKKPAHLSKVDKARSKLPAMDATVGQFFNELTVNFTGAQLSALAAHLQHHNRENATKRALAQQVKTGDSVRIVSGDSRFIGKTGTVTKAQRIRCYVEVEGAKKPVYLFTSDVEVVAAAASKAANG